MRVDSAIAHPETGVDSPGTHGDRIRIESRARRLWLLAPAVWLLPWNAAAAVPAKEGRSAERAWIERSAALARAAKEHAIVADFRRDIQEHRERLREIVRSNRNPPPRMLELQRSMILTNALLNAASECYSGGRLVCPADLMRQIDERLKIDFEQLNAIERGAR